MRINKAVYQLGLAAGIIVSSASAMASIHKGIATVVISDNFSHQQSVTEYYLEEGKKNIKLNFEK